ncbi:MAG: hypothetical protein ACXVEF_41905 [Polyangiales bacterium]
MSDLAQAVQELREGKLDQAIADLEALADRGVVGTGVAFDRGIAYALRARSGHGVDGDYGQAAHAFEEALRRDPHDGEAQRALEEIRREIAKRDARGKTEELGAPSLGRAVAVAIPGNAWGALALFGSLALAIALAVRPRVSRARRLAATTVAVVGFLLAGVATAGGLGARWLRLHQREAVVVVPHAAAVPEGGVAIDLEEGARVDVIEERGVSLLVKNDRGQGWAPRESLRMLPPYRP